MTTTIAMWIGVLVGLVLFIPIGIFIFWILDKIDDYKYHIREYNRKKEREMRTGHFVKYSDNYNFTYSSRDISRPGYNQELFLVYVDTDYPSLYEIIELEDGMKLHVQWEAKEKYAKNDDHVYGYKLRIITNNVEDFVNPEMLKEGRSFYVEPIDYKKK